MNALLQTNFTWVLKRYSFPVSGSMRFHTWMATRCLQVLRGRNVIRNKYQTVNWGWLIDWWWFLACSINAVVEPTTSLPASWMSRPLRVNHMSCPFVHSRSFCDKPHGVSPLKTVHFLYRSPARKEKLFITSSLSLSQHSHSRRLVRYRESLGHLKCILQIQQGQRVKMGQCVASSSEGCDSSRS